MPVTVIGWKPLVRNTLRGFATIKLGAALKISDVTVHRHESGKAWASFPSKPIINADGTIKKGDNGKAIYQPILEWDSKASADRFSEAVLAAIEEAHPGATQ
jgi:hypothetical protein